MTKQKHHDDNSKSSKDDNILEAVLPDYGDVGFCNFLRASKTRKSSMFGLEEDAYNKPLVKVMRVKIVHDNEWEEQIELSNITCENAASSV